PTHTRLRRFCERRTDAESARHARRGSAFAARGAALDRQRSAAVWRLRAVCAPRAKRHRRAGGGAVKRPSSTPPPNRAKGALPIPAAAHGLVRGTLAADTLDLTPYVSGIRLLARNNRNWTRLPITLEAFNDLSLDLRLPPANIKISNPRLGRTAVAA